MEKINRKRIAVLIGQPEEYSQMLFLKGFLEEAIKLDYDVAVFAMYIKYQNTQARCFGDSSIFKLISYDKFDCIIVLADTIQTKGEAERIEKELHEKYDGKVIFVDRDSEFFPSIHADNYTPEKLIIDHLIEKHGMKDIAFLTGKAWHPHSKIRLNAYKDSLTEHGIEVNENRMFYGDFWYTSGESLADSLIKSGDKLPEIVVELTEQSEISDDELKKMKSIYERIGIETAVDDYGTGYSNVSNLLRYTPDYVKIDRALLSGIQESPQKQHFVKDVIEFAHNNNIKALAEGVETSEELKTVIMLGADLVQGYYLAYPDKEMIQAIDALIAGEIRQYRMLRDSTN